MIEYYDISSWNEKPFLNTKGTRNKSIFVNPDNGKDYFFKTSLCKGAMDYKPEFWSEIIASYVGRQLGFQVLPYDLARHGEEIGCISRSMLEEGEYLTEGISLLTGYDNTYQPEEKSSYSAYTFHFIKKAIGFFGLSEQTDELVRTIVFDALIGNSDRHQENWAFITPYRIVDLPQESSRTRLLDKLISRFRGLRKDDGAEQTEKHAANIMQMKGHYSPIYDSGCCLAREKSEEDIKKMLRQPEMLQAFINRGKAEIRWGEKGEKLNHFDLVKAVMGEHGQTVTETIQMMVQRYDEDEIRDIIFKIDRLLPASFRPQYALSDERKELICRLIHERFIRLKNIAI